MSNELAETETQPPVEQAANIIQVIERAATNPDVDVGKMQQLLDMQERILDRNAKVAYTQALAAMADELPVVAERGHIKDRHGKIQSTYAKWEDINEAIKPILSKHGFHLSFRTGRAEDGSMAVTGVLSHREGHAEETTIYLPADQSGSKNEVQAVGSSASYGKRYTAAALLNLTTCGEDDDGQAAGAGPTISEDQAADLRSIIEEVGADEKKFLSYLAKTGKVKIDSIEAIPAKMHKDAVAALEAKRNRKKA